jgi:HlyD family secretion protein
VIDLVSPAAEWERLAHGYQVNAQIVLASQPDVLKLPLTALFRDADAWAVFVQAGRRAELRRVQIGARNGVEAEVVEGLSAGERIVLHPSDRVTDGVRITARH